MYTPTANEFILRAARKSDEMLEPYEWKRSRTVLRRERASNRPDLADYETLIKSLAGEVIRFSPNSKNHINALDISKEYGDGDNPITLKSSFVMSLYENLNNGKIDGGANSIVDRCVKSVYQEYIKNYEGKPPTLRDLRWELLKQEEPLAKQIALSLELFTEGTLDVFSHQTNVDMQNRILCFDVLDLGKQLKSIGMLIMLDTILNIVM